MSRGASDTTMRRLRDRNRGGSPCPATSRPGSVKMQRPTPTRRCAGPSRTFSPPSTRAATPRWREYSQRFDGWAPEDFRLSRTAIDTCHERVSARERSDIEFAQGADPQLRAGSRRRRCATSSARRCRASPWGHRNIPVNSVGCYVPGGKYPLIASAHMSVVTAKVAGVKRIATCAPPYGGEPHPAIVVAQDLGGADEIYCLGGVQAVGAMALGTESVGPGGHARRPREHVRRRGQGASSSAGSASTSSRDPPRHW